MEGWEAEESRYNAYEALEGRILILIEIIKKQYKSKKFKDYEIKYCIEVAQGRETYRQDNEGSENAKVIKKDKQILLASRKREIRTFLTESILK